MSWRSWFDTGKDDDDDDDDGVEEWLYFNNVRNCISNSGKFSF
jgi:hypothetical protein